MLQQILKDMYIDPDVLKALNEDQKKTLFLKMREEQVRRWKEREENQERGRGDADIRRTNQKKVTTKSVSWLLGRDGDVSVTVIGEVDELTSKFICSGFGEKKVSSPPTNAHHHTTLMSRKATEPVLNEGENLHLKTQAGIPLNLKPDLKSVSATEEEKSAPQSSTCPTPLVRTIPVIVSARMGIANLTAAAAATVPSPPPRSTVKTDNGTTSSTKADPNSLEVQKSHAGKDIHPPDVFEETRTPGNTSTCAGRGRVAQLMKAFSTDEMRSAAQNVSRPTKPPLPNKPSHLRAISTPTVR